MSLRDSIDAADDLAHVDVVVPEWKGIAVRLRESDYEDTVEIERLDAEWKAAHPTKPTVPGVVASAITLCVVMRDPATGARLYQPNDWPTLVKKNTKVLVRLFMEWHRIGRPVDVGESSAVPSGASS